MQACLSRHWFPIVFATVAKPKLHADDKDEDASVTWRKILDSCDVRPDEESAATDYVKGLMNKTTAKPERAPEPAADFDRLEGALKANPADTERPKAVEPPQPEKQKVVGSQNRRQRPIPVCDDDYWTRDHREPVCRESN
jgi:hypothetical protein